MKNLSIDIETYSSIDLAKCGVYKYCEAEDFEILLFGYSADESEVNVVDLASGESIPDDIINAIFDPTVIKRAYNAQFERICLSCYFGKHLTADSWKCTMVWAATLGLPLSLEGVGAIIKLNKQKLKEGKDLIRYFCKPCSPTKTNNGRVRNMPTDAPDKWAQFKEYNIRDVETELEIQIKLSKFPVSDNEWRNYMLDQEINDRGIRLDKTFVRQAILCDEQFRNTHINKARDLTGLDNPNSTQQLKSWLEEQGVETDSLNKASVIELLSETKGDVETVLGLRREMAKSSVKKYTAMENVICSDERAHGLIQFYGANRTGRYAGRLIQVQNLPQNHLPDLSEVRALVKNGQFDAIEMLYNSVPVVLSELIRTAFVPKDGYRFYVADFSAIEARIISWLAGEKWRIEVFATHGKIYEASASQMFHVPIEEITKGSPLRQKGKVAELACIAEGSLVLTQLGLMPIEKITKHHLLWDGFDWVRHDGIIYKGKREVITYEGLTATPDHLVWVEGKSEPIQFGVAATRGTHLIQSGNGRKAIWLGKNYKSGETMEQNNESLFCFNPMYRLRKYSMAKLKQFNFCKIQRLSTLFTTPTSSKMAFKKAWSCKAKMRKSFDIELQQIRRQRYKILFSFYPGSGSLDHAEFTRRKTGVTTRPNRLKRRLCTWKYPLCSKACKSSEPKDKCNSLLVSRRMAILKKYCKSNALKRYVPSTNNRISATCSYRKTKKLETNRSKVRVYDIRNAGSRQRFTVSNILVHNCGYGGGIGALKNMGALEMGVEEKDLQPLIKQWRQANPNIVKLWRDVDKAVFTAVKDKTNTETHGLHFQHQSGMLFIRLPSGRQLVYVKPKIETNKFGNDAVTYEGVGESKKWMRLESYGAKFVENIVQGIARDILAEAMIRLDKAGYKIVMHVHDEVVIEAPPETSLEKICEIMSETPEWAKGLLLRADGYVCDFYKKD